MYKFKRPLTLLWLHIQLSSPDVEMYWAPGPGWMEVHLSPLPSQRIRVSESGFCKPFHPPLCWPAKLTDNARLLTSNELYIFSLLIKSSSFHHCLFFILPSRVTCCFLKWFMNQMQFWKCSEIRLKCISGKQFSDVSFMIFSYFIRC